MTAFIDRRSPQREEGGKRVLADVAREEVSAVSGMIGSNPGGGGRFRNWCHKAAAPGRRWMPPPYW